MIMKIDEMIEILEAYKNGKEIEMFDVTECKWIDVEKPLWNFANCVYRIKKYPTRLEVVNEFWKKTFGISGKFTKHSCPANNCKDCPLKGQHPCCDVESWWNAPHEEPKIEK